MRDILFKAKRKDNGKWVEGYYIYHIKRTPCVFNDCVRAEDEQHVIMCDGFSDWNMPRDTVHYDIEPNTLCQYTGLTDKNGNKIWENDIVRIAYDDDFFEVGWIKYSNCGVRYNFVVGVEIYSFDESCDIEVIGNIFDNPELIGE